MSCCGNVTCCTESESADRLQDETRRSARQEEHRDQQGLRTLRQETVRHQWPNYGKANDVTNDQYTGCPKGRFHQDNTKHKSFLSPDFIYISTKFLFCSMYCLCVMRTVLLPPGVNPIVV
jgi:hypothetical protein